MNLIWYIYSNEMVSGPFSTELVEAGLEQSKWSDDALIWWKGQKEWISLEAWRKDLKSILEAIKTNVETSAWYIEHLGTQKGPMNVRELHLFIQSNGIIGSCRVWADGMERWMNIFEIPELVNFFGITRRRYPRAPIRGDVLIQSTQGHSCIAQAGSISAGGLGARGLETVKIGDDVTLTLTSSNLPRPVQSTARVVYTNLGGYTGLEFRELSKDFEVLITDYVSQFV